GLMHFAIDASDHDVVMQRGLAFAPPIFGSKDVEIATGVFNQRGPADDEKLKALFAHIQDDQPVHVHAPSFLPGKLNADLWLRHRLTAGLSHYVEAHKTQYSAPETADYDATRWMVALGISESTAPEYAARLQAGYRHHLGLCRSGDKNS